MILVVETKIRVREPLLKDTPVEVKLPDALESVRFLADMVVVEDDVLILRNGANLVACFREWQFFIIDPVYFEEHIKRKEMRRRT